MRSNSEAQLYTSREVTVFAPTDNALRGYQGNKKDARFILNHMANQLVHLDDSIHFPESGYIRISSLARGAPPLYVTRRAGAFYVNGAKISVRNLNPCEGGSYAECLRRGSNYRLHVVEKALRPLNARPGVAGGAAYMGLTAGELLRRSGDFDLGDGLTVRFASEG